MSLGVRMVYTAEVEKTRCSRLVIGALRMTEIEMQNVIWTTGVI